MATGETNCRKAPVRRAEGAVSAGGRRIRCWVITLAIGFIALSFAIYGIRTDVCYRCGAKRDRFLFAFLHPNMFVSRTRLSERVEELLGRPCAHDHWRFDCAITLLMGCADGFPACDVPILFWAQDVVGCIELLPDPEWRRAAADAIGDIGNRSKWTAVMVLLSLRERKDSGQTGSDDLDWEEWWGDNAECFEKTTDEQRALEVARRAMRRVGRESQAYDTVKGALPADIPALGGVSGDGILHDDKE